MEITKEDEKKFAILYERYMEKKNKEEMAEELFCKQGLEESMELKKRIESLPCEEEQVRLSFWDRIGLFF